MAAFERLGLLEELIQGVTKMGWQLPTPIQEEAIPLILGGGDVMAAAETGSGKTGAFALPSIQIAWEGLREDTARAQTVRKGLEGYGNIRNPKEIRMNGFDRHSFVALSEDGMTVQSRDQKAWGGCRANVGFAQSNVYFEAEVTDDGLGRVGWSGINAKLELGTDKLSFGYGGTAKKSHDRRFDAYGEVYKRGDTVGCFLDWDNNCNGKELGKAFDIPRSMHNKPLFPAVVLKNAEMRLRFQTPFKHPPSKRFTAPADLNAADVVFFQPKLASNKRTNEGVMVLVVEPSRELANQTADMMEQFMKMLSDPLRVVKLIGGESAAPQVALLQQGCEVAVGTPGRLVDLLETGKLVVHRVRSLVLDEADALVSGGNHKEVMKIWEAVKGQRVQVQMFSATLHSREVIELGDRLCNHPLHVDLKGRDAVPETVHHALVWCDPATDDRWQQTHLTDRLHEVEKQKGGTASIISAHIKRLKPVLVRAVIDAYSMEQCIIFCRTKIDCDNLARWLESQGSGGGITAEYSCSVLHSGRRQSDRLQALQAFKEGGARFLICTDVAARGIDISGLPFLINVTLPDNAEDYIHRVGRVGRADCMGLAISIVANAKEKVWYHTCSRRGKGCTNTQLVDKGGCCIWYDESNLIQDIETRLNEAITVLSERTNFAYTDAATGNVISGQSFGSKRGADGDALTHETHTEQLVPNVRALAELEERAQKIYFDIRRWRV